MHNINRIRSTVQSIASGLPISKAVLAGYYAKGKAAEQSGIDLAVDGTDLSEAYWDFPFMLKDAFSVDIDLMTARGLKNSCLRDNLFAGGVMLYGQ